MVETLCLSCTCTTCEAHWRVLDLDEAPTSADQIREAYRDAVKVWHPDRFESDARLRAKAENRFKSVQVAYRELLEHFENPLASETSTPAETAATPAARTEAERSSYDVFSTDDRCYVAPHITDGVRYVVGHTLGGKPPTDLLAVVDLSPGTVRERDLSSFLALSPRGLVIRDGAVRGFLPYDELDPERLALEDHEASVSGWWPQGLDRKGGQRPRYSLQLFRRNGTPAYTLDTPASDALKQALFNFLKARVPIHRA